MGAINITVLISTSYNTHKIDPTTQQESVADNVVDTDFVRN